MDSKRNAFSLMEMMVVMLVVAIVMALSAPMITKKTVSAGGGHCLWTSLTGGNIGFNANTDKVSVIIGGNNSEIAAAGANIPKLTIVTNSTTPHIGFIYDDKLTGSMLMGTNNTISIGNNSIANGSSTIAIGVNANASDTGTFDPGNSIAIGSNARSTGRGVIAIGKGAWGNYWDSIALGSNTNSSSIGSIAIGNNARAENQMCIAIGMHSHSGHGNSYFKHNAIAVGHWANAAGRNSIAMGYAVNSLNTDSIAIGTETNATGIASVAIGENCHALESNATAIGVWARTNSEGSTALGYVTNIGNNSTGAVAIRGSVFDNSKDAIAIGGLVNGTSSIGIGADVRGKNACIAIGCDIAGENSANSVVIAPNPYRTTFSIHNGSNSIAIGRGAYISHAKSSIAIGNNAYIYNGSSSSIVLGDNSKISAYGVSNAIAIGTNVKAGASNTIVIGHRISNSTPGVIQLGDTNTTVYIPGKIKFGNITANNVTVENDLYAGGETLICNLFYRVDKFASSDIFHLKGKRRYEMSSGEISTVTAKRESVTLIVDGKRKHYISDKRLKDIIGENCDAMDKIRLLKVYDYTFKKDDLKTPHVGVIAQDLQKVFPNAVSKDENGYLQIRHEDMFYAMINALKELDAKIRQIAQQLAENIKTVTSDSAKIRELTIMVKTQQKEISAQNKKIEYLEKEIAELKKSINKIK